MEKGSLSCCRKIRDAVAQELSDELEGYFEDEEAEKLIQEIVCKLYSSSLNKILEKFSNRRRSFDPETYYEQLAKFLFKVSKHVADLERERVQQPILIPA
jgi:hypothetical protein